MLTVAEDTLRDLANSRGKDVSIHLFGQEVNPETYAISKADLLLKGEGQGAENMKFGSTLSRDAFPSGEFDFMLSNPPYGKSWKTDLDRMGGKKDMSDHRFVVQHDGDELSLITRSSDGQLLFLVNKLTKMVEPGDKSPLGSRIAEVHNGSSLFTGDAGSGESNIRRWIIENDWLETIIALPLLEEGGLSACGDAQAGIEAFFCREVLPHVPEAWIDESATKLGYEISFTRHFYKPPVMRPLDEIKAELLKLQEEGEGLLEEILGGQKA